MLMIIFKTLKYFENIRIKKRRKKLYRKRKKYNNILNKVKNLDLNLEE